ncbi:MAG: NAD-dependent protein deacylase [Prevotella sp.]|nr:NAD-dependent protein deacylase [Prevotella sp.]MCM1074852.1 NAD-dependent protein deacylase [Ruminococcus sp.]
MKKKIVFSTGAGVSAESGITTFRDAGGLWEQYPVMQVASADGFRADPDLVHKFYNERRRQLVNVQPNEAHKIIADLEKDFDVQVITQNVDDLHERAGSSNVLHLHGELMKLRSISNPDYTETLSADNLESSPRTRGKNGDLMRPHIVFFQEAVPNIAPAMDLVADADILVVIGTSLNVYPAAGLISCARPGTPIYYIDPNPAHTPAGLPVTLIAEPATSGMKKLAQILRNQLPTPDTAFCKHKILL